MTQSQPIDSDQPTALGHLRVLDITGDLGQMCARFLGDLGADVVKVEPLGGDPVRRQPPFAGENPDPERSLRFINANTSKRSIALDMNCQEGQDSLCALVRTVDIIVEDYSPGYLDDLGLGYEQLQNLNDGLIFVSITPFGQTGPFRHYQGGELVAQATSGLMFANGDDTRRPCMAPYELMSQMACLHAAFGALAAVRARRSTGRGQHVDVSRREAVLYCQNSYISRYSYDGTISRRTGTRSIIGAVNTFQCSDGGFVNLSVFNNGHFNRLAKDIMNHPVLSNPEWSNRIVRRDKRDEIDGLVKEYLATVSRDEFVERGQRLGVPVVPVITAEEFVNHPHTVARDFFQTLEHPVVGRYRTPGPPIRMSGTPWRTHRPAPRLGEHTNEVLGDIDQTKGAAATAAGPPGPLPLEGIRVADFTRAFAGPLTTMYLAFFGAEVIRIESADLEDMRTPGEPTFPDLNRNKYSCTIDTRNPQGKQLLKRLVAKSDVAVENFRPGVMDRLGIGYEALRENRSDLIMVSMPGMGSSGPYRDFYSYGQQIMGVSGLVHLWGHPDTPLNARVKLAFPDYVAAIFSAVGILAALEHRDRTGNGQFLETAQVEATAHLLGVAYMEYTVNGRAPQSQGNFSETKAPHDVYPCLGQDAWCAIEAGSQQQWNALVQTMGNPDWASDHRFSDLAGRLRNKEELDRRIAEWTTTLTHRQVMHTLQEAGVPAGIVASGEDLYFDPQLRSRPQAIVSVDHPGFGRIEHQGINAHLSETPGWAGGPSPEKGQHNDYVFRSVLGMSEAEVKAMVEVGAIR